ncbi:MAG TPA: glutamate synthase [Marinilabiliales bacterium]|jgi:glutamate synthase (NADPH/NADH) small chain|nr:MAG: glutamate synthase [Bacteroidetes bacterium GWA2_40_14]OFX59879.1 MAG: glutamate synthase [Bacteroidetes bacterium GWC2_40_13]OFX75102.1 MAG: glutamate synthase [Bacteroidetes bacterium GWD2_40_43]OFX93849.1 MAG: glutamate synthase [Bacteroidetes bacterium GWE2_40_63]OFY18078.1 MAG: glutamate synthase [Bacteroidetes bacterium GWF2_40_13]OFZ27310.1 MAG: glutamate synthase [Bacteroidetes bacterium RIFOXYC2_FULL_40_12]HAM98988.1 glutamate synthase [Marinilabiliales bacterium]
MGKVTGFLEYKRQLPPNKPVEQRIQDFNEFVLPVTKINVEKQAARCMDCGVPFCHHGCPLGNNIPDFNDMVYKENWKAAYKILISTNNFPEFTGRICPAPCETSCVLSINKEATAIEMIEKNIIERAFKEGWVRPNLPLLRTNKKIAVIGSGPSGLAAASQLNSAGHQVTVFERADRIGGLLRYGIPDFKLEKSVLDRRIELMKEEGIEFKTGVNVGVDYAAKELIGDFNAILLTGGSTIPRDLKANGREAKGVHFAMDFLTQQNKRLAGDYISEDQAIIATGKQVLVIGGGDTGSDCVGTSIRQGALNVTQIEVLPKPAIGKNPKTPWPEYPAILRTSSSQQEGCQRFWSVQTKQFIADERGQLKAVKLVDVRWVNGGFEEIKDTEREIPCDLAFLSIGFVHPQHEGLLTQLGVQIDERGNVKTRKFHTSKEGVFAAGDMRRGQSLVVHAISEGREAAREIDIYLTGTSVLDSKNHSLINIR